MPKKRCRDYDGKPVNYFMKYELLFSEMSKSQLLGYTQLLKYLTFWK